MWHPV